MVEGHNTEVFLALQKSCELKHHVGCDSVVKEETVDQRLTENVAITATGNEDNLRDNEDDFSDGIGEINSC